MGNDTKALLKSTTSNIVSILGYISTAATFLPVLQFLHPYVRPLGVILIVVGIFRGALAVIKDKNRQLETVRSAKDLDIENLRAERNRGIATLEERIKDQNRQLETFKSAKDVEIENLTIRKNREVATLQEHITELSRKPYTEELKRIATQVLNYEMTLEGRHCLRYLMTHEPVEVGRIFIPEIPQDRQHTQLAIAMQHSIVQHKEDRQGALLRTFWVINPRFRPVLEDVLYEGAE